MPAQKFAQLSTAKKLGLIAAVVIGLLAVNYRSIVAMIHVTDSDDPKWIEEFESQAQLSPDAKLAEHLATADELSAAIEREDFEKLNAFFDRSILENKTIESGYDYFRAVMEHITLPERVEESLNRWVEKYPESVGARLLRANFLQGKAWRERGNAYAAEVKNEQWKNFYELLIQARQDIDVAVKLLPENKYTLHALLSLETANGISEEAKDLFARIIAVYPEFPPPYQSMLERLRPQWGGSVDEMFSFTRNNAKTYPNSLLPYDILTVHTYVYYASCKHLKDDANTACMQEYYARPEVWSEVSGIFETLLKNYPSSIWHSQYGRYEIMRGNVQRAVQEFDQAVKMNPGMPSAYRERAQMYEKQNDFTRAIQENIRLKKLRPNAEAYKNLYYNASQLKKPKLAAYYLQQAFILDPDDTFTLRNLCQNKISPRAIDACSKLTERFPHNPDYFIMKGALLSMQHNEEAAFVEFDKAVSANPLYHLGYLNRCYSHRMLNRLEKALDDCNQAVDLKESYQAYHHRALVYEALGDSARMNADVEKMRGFQDER
jgi:tetratricopeptide (TPR) repeat protein